MSDYKNVQLEGLQQFMYLIEHFGNTPEEALEIMKEHNQDTKDAEKFAKFLSRIGGEVVTKHTFNNKQKGNKNG